MSEDTNNPANKKPIFGYTRSQAQASKPESEAADYVEIPENSKKPSQDSETLSSSVDRLFHEITVTLTEADPSKWEHGGEELNPTQKYPRALDTWERVLARDIPKGVLVLKSSQPVKSQFFGGGYGFSPMGVANYTVELKPKGWNAKVMVDPYARAQARNEGITQTLVDGDLAEKIYKHVKNSVDLYYAKLRKEFEEQTKLLLSNLPQRIRETARSKWDKIEPDKRICTYIAYFDGIKVELQRNGVDSTSSTYKLMLSKETLKIKPIEGPEAREYFNTLVDIEKKTALMDLKKILDGAGI